MGFLPGFSNALAYLTTFVNRNIANRDFWSAVGNFDPLPYWREVDVPTLVLLGDQDINVPYSQSRDMLNALGMDNIRVVILRDRDTASKRPLVSAATTKEKTRLS